MKKKYFLLLLIFNFSSGQATQQDKSIRASMVYGYFIGIETALANISELMPNFRNEVNQMNLLLTTNFGQSKKNAIKYLNEIDDNWEGRLKPEMDSLKQFIQTNILFSTNEETAIYLKELEKNLKGNIPSPMLENVLSFQYQDKPSMEFSNGYTYTFSTKGHKKSKNTELILTIPKSWSSQEGKQPNVIQVFTPDCGNSSNSINIITKEMPFTTVDLKDLSFEDIDLLYREMFTEEFAKEMIDEKLISFRPMNIAGRAGFSVVYEIITEKMGIKIKVRMNTFIFHDVTYLHFINCGIGTTILEENLEEKSTLINPLFFMIVNSIVVPKKNDDIINLKGTEYQKIVDVKINDKTYDFILDTGATISLIGKNIINNLLENGVITNRNYLGKDYIQTADGKKHLVEFWNIPSIIIDGKKINDVDFTVMDGNDIKPLLGMNILNKLSIYKIDLENYKIYLKSEN
jgi:predicted aspartyl protease